MKASIDYGWIIADFRLAPRLSSLHIFQLCSFHKISFHTSFYAVECLNKNLSFRLGGVGDNTGYNKI